MATYNTEIHTGGGGWQQDEPLSVSISTCSERSLARGSSQVSADGAFASARARSEANAISS
ncbi:hypothetical protein [Streptomyces eurythermus]